jgi:hypothetical protein
VSQGRWKERSLNHLSAVVEHKIAFLDRNESLEAEASISSPKHRITWATIWPDCALAHVKWEIGASITARAMFRGTQVLH